MGRVAIVTGGTRGIGAAISVALKEAGPTVVAAVSKPKTKTRKLAAPKQKE